MEKNKSKSEAKQQDDPEVIIVDKRSSSLEEEHEDVSFDANERLPTYVERLKQDAEEKDKRLREYIAAYKVKSGEDDEFRDRLEKDNEIRLDQFKANLFSRLIPILDNLTRAIQTTDANKDFDSLNQGVEMVAKQFARELKNNNVEKIDTLNRKFDPKTDEVVMTEETADPEKDNTIVQELEPGYVFKGKLIKAAKVKVAHLKAP
jgi:molecular chaperone GrpE